MILDFTAPDKVSKIKDPVQIIKFYDIWRAKHLTDKHERIEIRKDVRGVQLLITVYPYAQEDKLLYGYNPHKDVIISANGKINMTMEELSDMMQAINEARALLITSREGEKK